MTLTTMIAELEEAKRAMKAADARGDHDEYTSLATGYNILIHKHLPSLIEAAKLSEWFVHKANNGMISDKELRQIILNHPAARAALKEPTDV